MTTPQVLIVVLAIGPIAAYFSIRLLMTALRLMRRESLATPRSFRPWSTWYDVPGRVAWQTIGGSYATPQRAGPSALPTETEPQFSTLRLEVSPQAKGKWLLGVQFQIWNVTDRELVIDDLHARVFERDAHAPPLATISFYGDVWLRQDNTLMRESRVYSLAPGDGYIMNLLIEATRIEAAPAYGDHGHVSEGVATVVFGLIADYYFNSPDGPERHAIPSDSIYFFQGWKDGDSELVVVDGPVLRSLKIRAGNQKSLKALVDRIEKHQEEHRSFRPVPRP